MAMREAGMLRCPVCSSGRVRAKPFQYIHNGKQLRGFACADCGIIFIDPQPTPEEITKLYSAEYFEGGDFRCGHAASYGDTPTLDHLVNKSLLREIWNRKPGGSFLEIGCAAGAFLHAALQMGYLCKGVELSADASDIARKRFGLEVVTGSVEEARFDDRSFEVVFMGDVIEHLANPLGTLQEVHRILKPGGLLVLELPSQTNSLFSRFGFLVYGTFGKKATVSLPPYHLFEYRPASLRYLLRASGFRTVRLAQGIIPPGEVNLRGPLLQRVGKKLFQYPNLFMTRVFRVCGDRITAFAVSTP